MPWISTEEANRVMDTGLTDRRFRDKFRKLIKHQLTSKKGKLLWDEDDVRCVALAQTPTLESNRAEARSNIVRQIKITKSGCWEWQGPLTNGYGPHVQAYQVFVAPVKAGQHLHHTCLNKQCVNPSHLQMLSPQEHRELHQRLRKVKEIGEGNRGNDFTDKTRQ